MLKRNVAILVAMALIVMTLSSCGEVSKSKMEDNLALISQPVVEYVYSFDATTILTDSGEVYTWGSNERGSLGQGLPLDVDTKIPQRVPFEEKIVHINGRCSSDALCAVSENGSVYAWGTNDFGLIPSDEYAVCSPVKIPFDEKVSNAKISHRFFIIQTESGDAYFMGWDMSGPLFESNKELYRESSITTFEMVKLPETEKVKEIETSDLYAAVLTQAGNVYVFGLLPSVVDTMNPTRIDVTEPIMQIGPLYNGIVLLGESGQLYFQGSDDYFIVSNEQQEYEEVAKINSVTDVRRIKTSGGTIIAQTKTNDLYVWGYNPRYNCAQSREEYVVTPQMVELPKIPYKLFCGEFNITVIGNEGIYTWGSNYRNQFLNPDKENTFTPQKIELSDIIE